MRGFARPGFVIILLASAAGLLGRSLLVPRVKLPHARGACHPIKQLSNALLHYVEDYDPPLPFPRYNIGLVNGKPGDLEDLKPGSVLSNADLRGAQWRRVDLRGVTLRNVDLRGANLVEVLFGKSRLERCNLAGANLADGDLAGAELADVDLAGANLYDVGYDQTRLVNVRMAGVTLGSPRHPLVLAPGACLFDLDLRGIGTAALDLCGVNLDRRTRWPAGFDPEAHGARRVE